jgi:hypothetical protein
MTEDQREICFFLAATGEIDSARLSALATSLGGAQHCVPAMNELVAYAILYSTFTRHSLLEKKRGPSFVSCWRK